jgi:hypothetical protein
MRIWHQFKISNLHRKIPINHELYLSYQNGNTVRAAGWTRQTLKNGGAILSIRPI